MVSRAQKVTPLGDHQDYRLCLPAGLLSRASASLQRGHLRGLEAKQDREPSHAPRC